MATAEDKQMVKHLASLAALTKAQHGARDFYPILQRGTGDRSTGAMVANTELQRIVLSVYSLKAAPAADPGEGEKPAPRSTAKASVTVKIDGFLNDSETYTIESFQVTKEGQASLELAFCPARYQVSVSVEGSAEYAVYGI